MAAYSWSRVPKKARETIKGWRNKWRNEEDDGKDVLYVTVLVHQLGDYHHKVPEGLLDLRDNLLVTEEATTADEDPEFVKKDLADLTCAASTEGLKIRRGK